MIRKRIVMMLLIACLVLILTGCTGGKEALKNDEKHKRTYWGITHELGVEIGE